MDLQQGVLANYPQVESKLLSSEAFGRLQQRYSDCIATLPKSSFAGEFLSQIGPALAIIKRIFEAEEHPYWKAWSRTF